MFGPGSFLPFVDFQRFRDTVDNCLAQHRPDVVELEPSLTPAMKAIQDAILEIMDACLKELQQNNMVSSCYFESE